MKPAEEYILNQPEKYRDIILNLQIIIENQIPELELLFKWKIPYYYYNGKPFCFINASHKGKYVDVAFNKGFQLQLYQDFLVSENRNTFKSLRFYSSDDINLEIITVTLAVHQDLY